MLKDQIQAIGATYDAMMRNAFGTGSNPIFTGGKNQKQYRKMVASNPHLRKSKKFRKSN